MNIKFLNISFCFCFCFCFFVFIRRFFIFFSRISSSVFRMGCKALCYCEFDMHSNEKTTRGVTWLQTGCMGFVRTGHWPIKANLHPIRKTEDEILEKNMKNLLINTKKQKQKLILRNLIFIQPCLPNNVTFVDSRYMKH
jgi:hypothetical protein